MVIVIKWKKRTKTIFKTLKVAKLSEEDGQLHKLEEKRFNLIKGFKPLFEEDVNDPSERGHD